MQLAFYKAFQPSATWLDNAVAVASLGKHSHVEIVFSDGISFSISPRDKCVRFKAIDLVPARWDLVDLKVTVEEEAAIRAIATAMPETLYDYIGALTSVMPVCIQDSNKVFCSELAVNLLRSAGAYNWLQDGCKYSPVELHSCVSR